MIKNNPHSHWQELDLVGSHGGITGRVYQIPVLQDNYIYLLHELASGETAVVDPALSVPVNQVLEEKKWTLKYIFNTHHHPDHVGGNRDLKKKWNCQVMGFSQDAHRIPEIDIRFKPDDSFMFGKQTCHVLFLPGHTLGHIAYLFPEWKILFCGDTLFGMGCGGLFEGSPQQMFDSLQKIKNLPPDTHIYCTHEYTERNGRFALQVHPSSPALRTRMQKVTHQRKNRQPTVPFLLSEDLQTNPFLLSQTVKEFARIRAEKDNFS